MQDSELIAALRSGSEPAFRTLVESYQNRVYNMALVIVQQEEEAEDVAQEVFIEVYQTIDRFREESRLSTWIYRITTSKALEHHRRRKAKKRFAFITSLFGSENEVLHEPADFHHPGVALENKEQMKLLFGAIAALPESQKVAFTLHYLNQASYQEVAEIMQNTVSAVESLLHRAKQNLRKQLNTYYTEFNKP
ncbi:RNA polymerase sigma factor [Nibrella saemangeumensis]|uniref:RNA polymerase sigma factor n=1 Tax=Nibrella saemangeumensis TaxID=1084526 RepID=A0ABP8MIH5_9BACT